MTRVRYGHLRIPESHFESLQRRNPPTTGGVSAPDERVAGFLRYLDQMVDGSLMGALSTSLSPDARAQDLGAYSVLKVVRDRFKQDFMQAVPPADLTKE